MPGKHEPIAGGLSTLKRPTTDADRDLVSRLVRQGYSSRTIERITGINRQTALRIARSLDLTMEAGEPSHDVVQAKRTLDARFADFERQPCPRTHSAWQDALRAYETVRKS